MKGDNFEQNKSKTDSNDSHSAVRGTSFGANWWFSDDEIYAGGPVERDGYNSADIIIDWASPGSQW